MGELFHGLLQRGALPVVLAAEHGLPPAGWPFVEYTVHQAYVANDKKELYLAWDGTRKQRKKGKNKGADEEVVVKLETGVKPEDAEIKPETTGDADTGEAAAVSAIMDGAVMDMQAAAADFDQRA